MEAKKDNIRIAAIGLLSLIVAIGFGRFAFTPLLPMMQADGLISIADGGLLASAHFLGYLLGALLAMRPISSPKRMLQASLLIIALGTLAMGVTESFLVWAMSRWLCGVCSALTLVLVSNYCVKRLAEAGMARWQGWVFSGVGAGITLAGLGVLALMASAISSADSWSLFGVLSILLAGLILILLGDAVPERVDVKEAAATGKTPFDWKVIFAYGAMGIGYIIPATYLPVMAREIVQSPLVFGWSWPVFGAAAFLSTIYAARLQARFSNRQIWIVCQLVMAIGLMAPVFSDQIASIIFAGLSVGGTFMIITMVGMKEAHVIATAGDAQRHIAALTAAFALGQMIGPVFAGYVYDSTQSFSGPLIMTSVLLAGSALMLLNKASR